MVYWLNEEDVQHVAIDELGRELTYDEVKRIVDPINENIDWASAISIAINQYIKKS